ncbi:hypothetical protein [Streptomyces sp. NPDC051219]
MAHYLHLTPRDVDELTIDEFDDFVAWIDNQLALTEEAASDG